MPVQNLTYFNEHNKDIYILPGKYKTMISSDLTCKGKNKRFLCNNVCPATQKSNLRAGHLQKKNPTNKGINIEVFKCFLHIIKITL